VSGRLKIAGPVLSGHAVIAPSIQIAGFGVEVVFAALRGARVSVGTKHMPGLIAFKQSTTMA
jgi:hypothetical protein